MRRADLNDPVDYECSFGDVALALARLFDSMAHDSASAGVAEYQSYPVALRRAMHPHMAHILLALTRRHRRMPPRDPEVEPLVVDRASRRRIEELASEMGVGDEEVAALLARPGARSTLAYVYCGTLLALVEAGDHRFGDVLVERVHAHGRSLVHRALFPPPPPAPAFGLRVRRATVPAVLDALAGRSARCKLLLEFLAGMADNAEDALSEVSTQARDFSVAMVTCGNAVLLCVGESAPSWAKGFGPKEVTVIREDDPLRPWAQERIAAGDCEWWHQFSDEEISDIAAEWEKRRGRQTLNTPGIGQ